jgi:hypothetical protein
VHGVIECLEVCPDLLGVHAVEFVVDLVQKGQRTLPLPKSGVSA